MSIKNFFRKINGTVTTCQEGGKREEVAEYRLWRKHGKCEVSYNGQYRMTEKSVYKNGRIEVCERCYSIGQLELGFTYKGGVWDMRYSNDKVEIGISFKDEVFLGAYENQYGS